MNIEEFKQLFLDLTEYTIPFGYEKTLEHLLPIGFKKDSIGNYYYEIGQSETLFTSHLDTFSNDYVKINHIIDNYIISTDGKTILGGDNKLGTSILISMIENKKPGTYYFFIGEEPLGSGGLYGSKNALSANPNFFKKFKRCIAFDRRGYGSIVTRQMARNCCSIEFATEIAKNLETIIGVKWDKNSNFGYYTDTAVFMDVIPEVTNLSAGGFYEHHKNETVDLEYTYKILEFALKMDWESLSVVRQVLKNDEEEKVKRKLVNKYSHFTEERNMKKISIVFDIIDFCPVTSRQKMDGREIIFSKWLEDVDMRVILNDDQIIIDNQSMTYNDFQKYFLRRYSTNIFETIKYYYKEKNYYEIKKIMKVFRCKKLDDLLKKMGL